MSKAVELDDVLRDMRILVADDVRENVRLLTRILHRAGYERVHGTSEAETLWREYTEVQPDILLLDLHMPGLDGVELLQEIRTFEQGASEYVPVVILTGDTSMEARRRALIAGASDFITKPYDPAEVVLRVRNLLELRSLHRAIAERNATLEARVRERTAALLASQVEMLERLASAAEMRDGQTAEHTRRVGKLAALLARLIGLPQDEVEVVRLAAPLHDIGKIAIPDRILHKAGQFTPEEYAVMKTHTTVGAGILSGGASALVATAAQIALSHHERWDGAGYPRGLAGADIPIAGRITAVADVFDALTHERVYRAALDPRDVARDMLRAAGSHFDPDIVRWLPEAIGSGDLNTAAAQSIEMP